MTNHSPSPFPLVRSKMLSQFPHVVFGMSTRQGAPSDARFSFNLGFHVGDDNSAVEERLRLFLGVLGLSPDETAFMDQVHGDRCTLADEAGEYPACDAIFTRTPQLGLAVRVADCIPIMLYAPGENLIAAIHAGWRGTAAQLASKTVHRLLETEKLDIDALYAYIGPGAAACCYEVGDDIAGLFPGDVLRAGEEGRSKVDLHAANVRQLVDAGLRPQNIETDALCTICNTALFHSHRRDGLASGRMLAVIALRREAD